MTHLHLVIPGTYRPCEAFTWPHQAPSDLFLLEPLPTAQGRCPAFGSALPPPLPSKTQRRVASILYLTHRPYTHTLPLLAECQMLGCGHTNGTK